MAPTNRLVGRVSLGLLALSVLALIATPHLDADLRPGSTIGQTLGVVAAVLMLASVSSYVFVRRSQASGRSKPRAQLLHSLVGTLGVVTALVHSHAYLETWPAWVLLAALGLLGTGLYGRLLSPQRIGRGFGCKALPFGYAADALPNVTLDQYVREKQGLATVLSAGQTPERQFVLRLHHWYRHPFVAWHYHRLSMKERRTIARHPLRTDTLPSFPERWWRRLHLALALLFVLGILAHVITTVFFAGYVAGGHEIYWWHVTDW